MAMADALPDTLNSAWKNNKSRFGYKMLQKMGWSEEKGLGKKEGGIVSAVKLKRRDDGAGLGLEKVTDGGGAKGWAETATSFSSVLDILKQTYSKDGQDTTKATQKDKKAKKEKKDKREDRDKAPPIRISVGMKYKKHSLAKSLSNKTDSELRSVLGAAASPRPTENSSSSGGGSGSVSATAGRKRSSSQAGLDESVEGVSTNTRQRSGSCSSVSSTAEREERERREKKERKMKRKEKKRGGEE